jgi:[protein-PII] uridylyltransferase
VNCEPLPARAVTEITVYTADHAGLFSRIAGALAIAGASIVDARIHTLTDGMALDTFWIQDAAGGPYDAPHRLARLVSLIEQALSGRLKLSAEIRKATRSLIPGRMSSSTTAPPTAIRSSRSTAATAPACCTTSPPRSPTKACRSPRLMSPRTACAPSTCST